MSWYVNLLFAQAAPEELSSIPWYVHLLVAVGTLAVSFFLGGYLGKKLRMPDHGWKIGLCLFTLLASVVVVCMGPPVKYGIDLSGGVILVYEVDQTKKTSDESVDMEKLIAAVKRRVNPGGQKEWKIRKYGVEQIEIIIPELKESEVQRIERTISRAGNLEFRILANDRHNKELIARALADPSRNRLFDSAGHLEAWWVPVKQGEEVSFDYPEIARRKRTKRDGSEVLEVLVLKDMYDVNGGYLANTRPSADPKTGKPSVDFTFNSAGGNLFGKLTGDHMPDKLTDFYYKLGIVLDDELYTAPRINDRITDRGEISGGFNKMEEAQDLVNVLNAGSLPAALTKEPISRLYSGPTLGQDTIEKSKRAMLIAAILVPLFMLWYYRFSGVVADIVLALNLLILFAIMLTIKAALTLTGFAGLVLTVGMAVDNNVLIYERLREELERGAGLRMAIRNAFQRASTTIIDANLTTLITATVLYVIGTDQIKGFAVVLWLGVAISMFTSVFVARVIFDIAEKRQWITRVKMLRVIGHTNIDFMSWFRYTCVVSIVVIVIGIAAAIERGKGLFDIDFTSGVSVQALFDEPQDIGEVRKLLTDELPDLAVTDVQFEGQDPGLQFVVNTSEPKMENVRHVLSEVFGDKLTHNTVTAAKPRAIPSMEEEASPAVDDTEQQPAEPAATDQSRRTDLPADTMLAFAGENALALALADEPAKAAAEEPAKAAAEEPAPAEPVEVPGSKTAPRRPLPSEVANDAAEKPAPDLPDPYAGGLESTLTFQEAVNHQAVEEMVAAALTAMELKPESTPFELLNPKYREDDDTPYAQWELRTLLSLEQTETLLATLEQQVAENPVFPASSTIGAAVAGNTQRQAVLALVASWVCMIIYLWIRFQGAAFGLAAVVALIHDVLIILGAIAISSYVADYLGFLMIEPFKINLPIVAAFLTVIGYSANDTIVVFDRIREVRGKDPNLTRAMVNASTNQTLSRTLLTSFTALLVIVVLYVYGGEAIHGFAFSLIIGVMTGTYSSIYVAAPILLWLVGKRTKGAAR